MKKYYLSLFLLFIVTFISAAQYNKVVFFTHAHQDDAVYFSGIPMSDYVMNNRVKTVFILFSASDQGAHTGVYTPDAKPGNTYPFYKARDYGLMKAVEFCSTNGNLPTDFAEEPNDVTINGKTIRKWIYRNSIIYFFDLPNGQCCSLNMNGYPANNYQTIEKLKKGLIPTITSMNNQTYTWDDLVLITKTIFQQEAANIPNAEVYSSDVDFSKNPNDHADHYITSVLALEAMSEMPNFTSKLHVDYHLSNLPANVSHNNIVKKTATFGAMVSGLATKGYKAGRHLDWFNKEYIREANISHELTNLNPSLRAPINNLQNPDLTPTPDKLFLIKNVHSNLVLSFDNQGKLVQQSINATNENQKWYVIEQRNKSFVLLNLGTGKLIETPDLPKNGDKLHGSIPNNLLLKKQQQFFILSAGNTGAKYILSAVNPILYFELFSSNTQEGFEINLWHSNGGYNNQKWLFESIQANTSNILRTTSDETNGLLTTSGVNALRVFPNPVNNTLTLSFDNPVNPAEVYQVNLINLSGISFFKGSGYLTDINRNINSVTGSLPSGIYLIQVKSETKSYNVKFIKQ